MNEENEKEHREFRYLDKDESKWRIRYPGGYKFYKKKTDLPDEHAVKCFIDCIIEECGGCDGHH